MGPLGPEALARAVRIGMLGGNGGRRRYGGGHRSQYGRGTEPVGAKSREDVRKEARLAPRNRLKAGKPCVTRRTSR